MLDAGEDPLYLARRVVRMAIEDIGLADPQALVISNAAKDAYDFLGSPEGELAIAEAVIYVATAPKSNAAYAAYGAAMRAAKESGSLLPPKHILNAPTKLMKEEGYGRGYAYDHDAAGGVLRPELFPGRARPPDVLRPARARLRARDQEAAGLLGQAAQGQGGGLILTSCVGGRAIGAAWCVRACGRAVGRPLGGRGRSFAPGRRRHARTAALIATDTSLWWADGYAGSARCTRPRRSMCRCTAGRRADLFGHARRPAAIGCG